LLTKHPFIYQNGIKLWAEGVLRRKPVAVDEHAFSAWYAFAVVLSAWCVCEHGIWIGTWIGIGIGIGIGICA